MGIIPRLSTLHMTDQPEQMRCGMTMDNSMVTLKALFSQVLFLDKYFVTFEPLPQKVCR